MMKLRRPLSSRVFCLALGACLAGCSSTSSPDVQKLAANSSFQPDGAITLSFPIPSVVPASELYENFRVLGFSSESTSALKQNWLLIDTSSRRISLMNGPDEVESTVLGEMGPLHKGMTQLKHKQRDALWYAPDSYFLSRGLEVPPAGDKTRYLRGALGEFALFIDKDTPVHSGPVWSEEVGGVHLSEPVLSKFYYTLQVGDQIEIR